MRPCAFVTVRNHRGGDGAGKKLAVSTGDFLTQIDLFRENREFCEQNSGLKGVKAAVDPDPDVLVLVFPLAVYPDRAEDLIEMIVVREAHPSVAITAQGLGREERGAGDLSEGAGFFAFVVAAEGLGGILDDLKAVTGGDGFDGVVVRGEAEKVDGDDGAGAEGLPCRFGTVLGPAVNHAPVGEGRLNEHPRLGCRP